MPLSLVNEIFYVFSPQQYFFTSIEIQIIAIYLRSLSFPSSLVERKNWVPGSNPPFRPGDNQPSPAPTQTIESGRSLMRDQSWNYRANRHVMLFSFFFFFSFNAILVCRMQESRGTLIYVPALWFSKVLNGQWCMEESTCYIPFFLQLLVIQRCQICRAHYLEVLKRKKTEHYFRPRRLLLNKIYNII